MITEFGITPKLIALASFSPLNTVKSVNGVLVFVEKMFEIALGVIT